MTTLLNIKQILLTLEVGGNQVLFILLGDDGSINRMGDGSADCRDSNLFIGKTQNNLIEQLKPFITNDIQEFLGQTFDAPNKKGRICNLQVLFKDDNTETGVRFLYGELSQGPPLPFKTLVTKAVRLTDSWVGQQRYIASKNEKGNKPWWKFW